MNNKPTYLSKDGLEKLRAVGQMLHLTPPEGAPAAPGAPPMLPGLPNGAPNAPPRELTYEPDIGRYEATIDIDRVADALGGRVVENRFGRLASSFWFDRA